MLGLGWKVAALMALLALGAGGWGAWQSNVASRTKDRAVAAEAVSDSLRRAMEAQARAASVLRAERDRFEARAEEYDRLRETLINGGDNADIPDWLRSYLDSLLQPASGTGGTDSPR